MGATVIDFKTHRSIMVDEGKVTLSKSELLENILAMLNDEQDDIDEIVIGFFGKDGSFRAHTNVEDGGAVLWIVKQIELGVLGV